jgi:hypothetical protein
MSKLLCVVLELTRYKWISTFPDLPDPAVGMLVVASHYICISALKFRGLASDPILAG